MHSDTAVTTRERTIPVAFLDFRRHNDPEDEVQPWARYLPSSAVLRDSGLSCRGVGQQSGTRPPMAIRRLATHGILCVTSGHGSFTGPPDGPTPVVAPAVIWLFPGIAHRYEPANQGWTEHWVLFEGVAVRAYEALAAWRRDRPVRSAGPGLLEAIAPLFAALRRSTATPGPRAELLAATLTHALIGVAAEHTQSGPGRDETGRPTSGSAVDAVVSGAFGPATVAERARACGRTPDQLRREVAEETDLSVHELVIRSRVARAQEMLATTDLPVAGIARQVGYDDPAYFSRVFSIRVGTTPTAFRREAPR